MSRQAFHELQLTTSGRGGYEITRAVADWIGTGGFQNGLVTLQLRHTSASLLIQENADPDVRTDLENFFQRLVPDGDRRFRHHCEGPDDMPAHIRTALTAVTLGVPVQQGRLTLGTWQGIYVWEHRSEPHVRKVSLHFIGE